MVICAATIAPTGALRPMHIPTYIHAYSRYKYIRVWTQIQIEKSKHSEEKMDRETNKENEKRNARCHLNLYDNTEFRLNLGETYGK